eukprot:TRINITY_DN440_c0_g1_i2.p1 TRINITY_DN440_c0_g1~~TRINITY_DN440_c0_g1_i2.p1  ORF type:complete len:514 (-),score=71.62 TRINITY_DN440_c0_g1_i2:217-1758(-)
MGIKNAEASWTRPDCYWSPQQLASFVHRSFSAARRGRRNTPLTLPNTDIPYRAPAPPAEQRPKLSSSPEDDDFVAFSSSPQTPSPLLERHRRVAHSRNTLEEQRASAKEAKEEKEMSASEESDKIVEGVAIRKSASTGRSVKKRGSGSRERGKGKPVHRSSSTTMLKKASSASRERKGSGGEVFDSSSVLSSSTPIPILRKTRSKTRVKKSGSRKKMSRKGSVKLSNSVEAVACDIDEHFRKYSLDVVTEIVKQVLKTLSTGNRLYRRMRTAEGRYYYYHVVTRQPFWNRSAVMESLSYNSPEQLAHSVYRKFKIRKRETELQCTEDLIPFRVPDPPPGRPPAKVLFSLTSSFAKIKAMKRQSAQNPKIIRAHSSSRAQRAAGLGAFSSRVQSARIQEEKARLAREKEEEARVEEEKQRAIAASLPTRVPMATKQSFAGLAARGRHSHRSNNLHQRAKSTNSVIAMIRSRGSERGTSQSAESPVDSPIPMGSPLQADPGNISPPPSVGGNVDS